MSTGLALFWQLADRWGTVTAFGVAVSLQLTHEVLGRLVGAQRPTVTLALSELAEAGLVVRVPKAGWLLSRDSYGELGSVEESLADSPTAPV